MIIVAVQFKLKELFHMSRKEMCEKLSFISPNLQMNVPINHNHTAKLHLSI